MKNEDLEGKKEKERKLHKNGSVQKALYCICLGYKLNFFPEMLNIYP